MQRQGFNGTLRAVEMIDGRKPKVYPAGRVCLEEGCGTKLSIYNRHEHCWYHRPKRFPRVRGRESVGREPRCASCAARARRWGAGFVEVYVDGVVHREGFDGAATLCEVDKERSA